MRFLFRLLLPALGLMLCAGAAGAQRLLVDKSEIRFVSKQLGVNVEGRFRTWKANIVFLPKDLARSKAEFDIDLGSIDLASDESETEIKSPSWFNIAKFPQAHFASTSIKGLGGDRYEISGKLTLKGVTRDVVVPIAFKKDSSGNSVAEGSFPLKRNDYKVGEGMWSDTDLVADDVQVRIRMVLVPA
jgi:polyisoprenoid-binding protein YceI